jgi:predicted TIM-barrel fold metal-dependent hydrolase
VRRWQAAWPERVLVGTGFNAAESAPDLALLRAAMEKRETVVLGEIGAQYEGLTLADPQFEPYLALAEELGLPVGVHTGLGPQTAPYQGNRRFRTAFGNPQLIEDVLVRHPKLRLYLMHAGCPYLEQTIAIMAVYPQVYADLSVINWMIPRAAFHEYLRGLMRAGFGKRLMFGSDQMVWPDAIGMAIEGIESADFLSASEKRDIFYNNAARFLGLDGSTGAQGRR